MASLYFAVVVACNFLASGCDAANRDWTCQGDSEDDLSLLQVKADTIRKQQVNLSASRAKNPTPSSERLLEKRWRLRKDARLNEVLVVPELKLVFCFIPKNACTQFNRLINALNGISDGEMCTDQDPNYKSTMRNFTAADLEDALNDPTWTKAVFLRDPLERLVSAFRSKCEEPRECGGGDCPLPAFEEHAKFRAFMEVADSLEFMSNAHFLPQSSLCGGLGDNIGAYDFVGHISHDYASVAGQVRDLLTHLMKRQAEAKQLVDEDVEDRDNSSNAFVQEDAATFIPMLMNRLAPFGKKISDREASVLEAAADFFPAHGPDAADPHVHVTGNVSKYYANMFALHKALAHYQSDYDLLPGLHRPMWARFESSLYYDTAGSLEPRPTWLSEDD
jgi:hypothetical protein